jgi:uncharacterized YccA/Bax inhibitor family protein
MTRVIITTFGIAMLVLGSFVVGNFGLSEGLRET